MTTATKSKQQQRPLPWMNQMLTDPFYVLHFFLFMSYFAVRLSAVEALSSDEKRSVLHREIQMILGFLVFAIIKIVREESWEGFIGDTLFYAKFFLFAVTLFTNYHLALCYIPAFLVIFVLAQQPAYDGLGDSSQLTPSHLEALLTEGDGSRYWLVEFYSFCSFKCIRSSRFIPELSVIFSNKNLSFASVNLGLFPNAAEKFGISLGMDYGHLPTYILFDRAVEVRRFPQIGGLYNNSNTNITKKFLCRYFELDHRLIEYIAGQ